MNVTESMICMSRTTSMPKSVCCVFQPSFRYCAHPKYCLITVTSVWNTGETSNIYWSFEPKRKGHPHHSANGTRVRKNHIINLNNRNHHDQRCNQQQQHHTVFITNNSNYPYLRKHECSRGALVVPGAGVGNHWLKGLLQNYILRISLA